MSAVTTRIIHVDIRTWMQTLRPLNATESYYVIGDVTDIPNTLCVTRAAGAGRDRKLYCKTHYLIYEPYASCPKCQKQVPNPS